MNYPKLLIIATALAASGVALAHGEKPHGANAGQRAISTEQNDFGREGDPRQVTRTVRVEMNDTMRFKPGTLAFRRGDIVRFEVKNSGRLMHEMVLGTMTALTAHAELMRKHPGMEHDEPYMAHVAPGKTETIIWHFTHPGEFYYGCLVAGHFEAGMVGTIVVR